MEDFHVRQELAGSSETSNDIDKLSISNVQRGSERFWSHIIAAYAFTFWTCYILMKEYGRVAAMRLQFLAAEKRRPDQFSVLVRNIPPDPDESVSELVEHFFLVNHSNTYLTHQVVYNANRLAKLVKKKSKMQNWLVYYQNKLDRTSIRPEMKNGFLTVVPPAAYARHIPHYEDQNHMYQTVDSTVAGDEVRFEDFREVKENMHLLEKKF
jgi:hypothetical protein